MKFFVGVEKEYIFPKIEKNLKIFSGSTRNFARKIGYFEGPNAGTSGEFPGGYRIFPERHKP